MHGHVPMVLWCCGVVVWCRSNQTAVVVNVLDINDNIPRVITASLPLYIPENAQIGSFVAQLIGT